MSRTWPKCCAVTASLRTCCSTPPRRNSSRAVCGFAKPSTNLKRVEVALVESESRIVEQLRDDSARKDEFLAMLAHELRNPLAPIRTGLELIRRGGDSEVAIARVRAMMERQVGHMVRLIDDLLDVSRITSGKIALQREPTPLGGLVYSAVEANLEALSAKQIALKVELPPDPCVIDVDHTRLVQILSNLLHNAAKFTDHGGSVRVSAAILPPASDARPQVLITVADSGIGISPELAAAGVRSLHARRDALLATWPGHRPRTRPSPGGTSRRTPRRPQ